MYIELQISYSTDDIQETNMKQVYYFDFNRRKKFFCELSEYVYYFTKFGIINLSEIDKILLFAKNLQPQNVQENMYNISKSLLGKKEIFGLLFHEFEIKYPHLVCTLDNEFFVITEITIREKQKAIGIQPMLYFCFPITLLKDYEGKSLLHRNAYQNEKTILEIDSSFSDILKNLIKIFAILSNSHRIYIIKIMEIIKKLYKKYLKQEM